VARAHAWRRGRARVVWRGPSPGIARWRRRCHGADRRLCSGGRPSSPDAATHGENHPPRSPPSAPGGRGRGARALVRRRHVTPLLLSVALAVCGAWRLGVEPTRRGGAQLGGRVLAMASASLIVESTGSRVWLGLWFACVAGLYAAHTV